jgi:alanine-glyoxylate transaminase / serine-glyoxylate transaminase / serine-pyruvate transaminase
MTAPLAPPPRLLCGPGPTSVDPAALAAMQKPMLGHLDPELHDVLLEVVDMLRVAWCASGGVVLPLQATGTSGMETGIASLVEPGDTVIVGVNGYFGRRICEIAARWGASVVPVEADWGAPVSNAALLSALDAHPSARVVAVVHGETSTGVRHDLAALGQALRETDTLLMVDCVTTLGGVEVDFDGWGLDYAYSCTQKCLGAPPGMSPVAVSDRALERLASRGTPVPFAFDLQLLHDYWVKRPATYHHTTPVLHVYALHAVLRAALDEGLEERWARHSAAGSRLRRRVEEAGLSVLADEGHRLDPLTAVRVPDGVDGKAIQAELLRTHSIEVGGGLGPAAPPMWRIGLMGPNASPETADTVLDALIETLDREPALAG